MMELRLIMLHLHNLQLLRISMKLVLPSLSANTQSPMTKTAMWRWVVIRLQRLWQACRRLPVRNTSTLPMPLPSLPIPLLVPDILSWAGRRTKMQPQRLIPLQNVSQERHWQLLKGVPRNLTRAFSAVPFPTRTFWSYMPFGRKMTMHWISMLSHKIIQDLK